MGSNPLIYLRKTRILLHLFYMTAVVLELRAVVRDVLIIADPDDQSVSLIVF